VSTPPRLLDRVRDRLRYKHYSMRTEQAYIHWIKRFIYFHGKRHPEQMNGPEVEAFLTHLATKEKVAAATQSQALSALLFLYKEVIGKNLPWLDGVVRPKAPGSVAVVLMEDESACIAGAARGHALAYREHALWNRDAVARVPAATREGCRLRNAADHDPGSQGQS
jgi:hypothetical protein